ncbi:hypothetical protein [Tumebacillus avium]|uniref:hypothetical protein n=1 Tax=Tumebacillus avium TaxID=1903704 RepID=UPI0012FD6FAB|nr:hypothetical protein [Tumebacillus avium]
MSLIKKLSATAILLSALCVFASPTYAATALCYYSFNSPWGAGSLTNSIEGPAFVVNNTAGVVSIKGWQDTPYSGTPNVYYELMRSDWGFDTTVGSTTIRGGYPQSSSALWYYHTFTGVQKGTEYYIRMSSRSSTGMDGAGNAYDGY